MSLIRMVGMTTFSADTVSAVLTHMNGDHPEDNLLIVRAFGESEPISAKMVDLDENGGTWEYSTDSGEGELRVPWSGKISERGEIRREIVVLYERACELVGIEPRPH